MKKIYVIIGETALLALSKRERPDAVRAMKRLSDIKKREEHYSPARNHEIAKGMPAPSANLEVRLCGAFYENGLLIHERALREGKYNVSYERPACIQAKPKIPGAK